MSLSDWANIAIIVQGIVIIVSLGFVFYQLRENARLTRAANTQKLVELTSPFALQLMQDRSTAELWVHGAHTWDTMDSVDRERYTHLVSRDRNSWMKRFIHRGLMIWKISLRHTTLHNYGGSLRSFFSPSLSNT
jgi:3-methyladenine DNA glycosylase AlkD